MRPLLLGHREGTPSFTLASFPADPQVSSIAHTIIPAYDHNDVPSSITLKNSASTLQSFSYSDAPASTILTECDTTPSCSQPSAAYSYDALGRVASMTPAGGTTSNYGFDASGNLTTLPTGANATSGYDKAGELTSSVLSGLTTSYTYDQAGNRLTATQGGTTITSGTWNGAAELTSYTGPGGTMTGAVYDGEGFRTSATFTPSGGSPVTESYVWDPTSDTPSLLMDSANAYIYGDGGTPAEQVNLTTGTATYLIADSLGSVRGTVNSSGALTGTTSYDAWGNPSTTGGLTATTAFGYAGSYTDPTGLDYLINPTLFLWLRRVHDIAVAATAFNEALVYQAQYTLSRSQLLERFTAEHYVPGVSKNGKEKYGREENHKRGRHLLRRVPKADRKTLPSWPPAKPESRVLPHAARENRNQERDDGYRCRTYRCRPLQ